MQGFKAQLARAIKKAKIIKCWEPQDHISDANKKRNQKILRGSQHTANAKTIAKAIFDTLRFLC